MARRQRHAAEVTSDRLADALDKWPGFFDGRLRDMVGEIRAQLDMIAETQLSRGGPRVGSVDV